MPPKEKITLDIVLSRQSVSAAGVIWQPRRVVVTDQDISFGRPGQHMRLDYMWLHDIKRVQIQDSLTSAMQATPGTPLGGTHHSNSFRLPAMGKRGVPMGTPNVGQAAEGAASEAGLYECRGFLYKKGQVNTAYQKRYFVLRQVR